jgi:hypothetical protein
MAERLRFVCIDDGVPEETTRLLSEACAARGIDYAEVDAPAFDFAPGRALERGDLLYRPSGSLLAERVEQFVYRDGVATFHRDPDGPFFVTGAPVLMFERAGVPVPRSFLCGTAEPAMLRSFVEGVGGLPVVLKSGTGEGGVGVLRADSYPSLFSIVDHALAQGTLLELSAYVDRAVHHRVVVVGERGVATYRNVTRDDDFRSSPSEDPKDYSAQVPAALEKIALRAARALRLDFAGVDVLEHPSGRLYVLEANFPCFHPQAQLVAGIDVSGAMVDELLAKARRLLAAR